MSKRLDTQYTDQLGTLVRGPGKGTMFAQGNGAPTASIPGYAKGCIYIDRSSGTISHNTGTKASATWSAFGTLSGNVTVGGTLEVVGAATFDAASSFSLTLGVTGLLTLTAGVINNGTSTGSIGGSTAAAGTTTADAGVLPAGTATVYPTTAADDTKGVRIDVADKVTGRTIFIGNGVGNKILKIYPPAGGTINGLAGDAAYSTASGKGALVVCLSSGANTWLALG